MVQTNGVNTGRGVGERRTVLLMTLASGTDLHTLRCRLGTDRAVADVHRDRSLVPNTLTANVTLPITCVTNHYNIIATVSGLAGTGLHLQVAPTAAVAATANATSHTPASAISGGAHIGDGADANSTGLHAEASTGQYPPPETLPMRTKIYRSCGHLRVTSKFVVNAAVSGSHRNQPGNVA